ncbi:hypothetical protein CHUAL_002290 [Chamberlinius hualienensis]
MQYVRGNKNDFDNWAKMGNTGWSYKDILPYFLKSEGMTIPKLAADTMYHNGNGPLTVSYSDVQTKVMDQFLIAGQMAGYRETDINAANQTGFMKATFTMRSGARCSTAKAFLVPAKYRPNLTILCKSRVTKILFENKNEAVGVIINQDNVQYVANASKEILLSAGAIASPQLLMLSGIGSEEQLQQFKIPVVANLPGVGENLQDHVGSISLFWKVKCTDCAFVESDFYSPIAIAQWLLLHKGILTMPFGVEAIGYINTKYANQSADWPDVQLLLVSVLPPSDIEAIFGISKEILEKYMEPLRNSRSYTVSPFLMRPKSKGTVKLQSSNAMDNPLIDLNMLSHPDDMKIFVEGLKAAFEIGNSSAFKSVGAEFNPAVCPGCENYTFLSDNYLECLARQMTYFYFHAAGTCKMGVASDRMAVVDNKLKVYGVSKLRVIDASIMPEIVSANTNAASIMIAERASDFIRQEY